jgi:hypothetical protein
MIKFCLKRRSQLAKRRQRMAIRIHSLCANHYGIELKPQTSIIPIVLNARYLKCPVRLFYFEAYPMSLVVVF